MSELDNKTVPQPNPGEGVVPGQNSPASAPVKTQGIPQERFDEIYRKWKESEEARMYLLSENSLLKENVNSIPNKTVSVSQPVPLRERKEMTDEEWNVWFQENPREALRWEGNKIAERERERATQQVETISFRQAQAKSREKLVTTHSDMYLKDSSGQVKRNPDGMPLLDVTSEKVRIFEEIIQENPGLTKVESGPELAMIKMEKILAQRNIDINKVKEEGVKEGIHKATTAVNSAKGAFTAPSSGGNPPSAPSGGSELSESEKRIADKMGVGYADYAAQKNTPRHAPRTKISYS